MSKESQENEDALTPRHAESGTRELPANEITPEIPNNIMATPCQIYSPQSESISGFGNPMGYPTYPLNYYGQMTNAQPTIWYPPFVPAVPAFLSLWNYFIYTTPGSIPTFVYPGASYPYLVTFPTASVLGFGGTQPTTWTGSAYVAAQPNATGGTLEPIEGLHASNNQMIVDPTNEVNPNATPITENPQVQDVTNEEIPSTDHSLIHTTNELKVLEEKIISLENTMRDENNKLKDENKELKDKLHDYEKESKKIKNLHQKILPTWIAFHGIPKKDNDDTLMPLVLLKFIGKNFANLITYATMVPDKENEEKVIILVNFVTYNSKILFLNDIEKKRKCLNIVYKGLTINIEGRDYPISIREPTEADFGMQEIYLVYSESDETNSEPE